MDKYEACKKIQDDVKKVPVNLEWCNKETFAKEYQKHTGLKLKTVLKILTDVNKSYPIVWYHTKGFIFSTSLTSKPPRSKFVLDWGTYYTLFHLNYPREFVTHGGNYTCGTNGVIHGNIYIKGPYDFGGYQTFQKFCLGHNINTRNVSKQLVKSGDLISYLDQMTEFLKSNDGNALFKYFKGYAYKTCDYCGDYINVGKIICDTCSEK